jgi:branched-chain amino acid transport system permease protein
MTQLWPYVVIGLFGGSLYALAAVGVVLTYKTSGVFNLAYGGVAMFCSYMYWQLRDQWGLPTIAALAIVLFLVAPVIGVLLERLFRPLSAVSAEVQLVVSLAVLGFLQALALLIYGSNLRALASIFPTTTFKLGSIYVGYDQLYTLIVSIALSVLLWGLLRRTRFGTATRAVVDNRGLAMLLGVNTTLVARVTWAISTMFAAIVGILLSTSQGLNVQSLVAVVTFAFAPAVLARLVSLPVAYAGGIALGIIQSVLARWSSSGTIAELEAAVPYLALFVLLVVYGRRLKEVASSIRSVSGDSGISGWSTKRTVVTAGAAFICMACLPRLLSVANLRELTAGVVYAIIALSLVVLMGWAGQISLAQFSFAGVGAFAAGHWAGANGSHFFLAILAGVAIAIPLGIVVGLPALRLSGVYLALATMAFALAVDTLVFARTDVSGGAAGMAIPRPRLSSLALGSDSRFYYLSLVFLTVCACVAAWVRKGAIGRRLRAIRDSPIAAETLGVNLTLTKLAVFAAAAAVAAIGGALYGSLRQTVSSDDFTLSASLQLLLLVVFAGRSLIAGALFAGLVFTLQLLPALSPIEAYIPLAVALGAVVVAQNPEGQVAVMKYQAALVKKLLHKWRSSRSSDDDEEQRSSPPGRSDEMSGSEAETVSRSQQIARG